MTNNDDRDPSLEELLRSTLGAEADAVTPRGDGLTRIQQRISARRSRRVWMRPLAAVGAVAVAGGAAFTAYAVTHDNNSGGDDRVVTGDSPTPTPTGSESPSPSSATTPSVAAATYPRDAFFPFTSAAAERSWEHDGGATSHATYTDPVRTAQAFARDFVGARDVSLVLGRDLQDTTATVTLGRNQSDGASKRAWPVTAVRLVKYGAAWVVVGADDAKGLLQVTAPASGAQIVTPVTVTGPAYGVDEAIRVDVRGTHGSLAAKTGHASFGNGSPPWSAKVSFDPRSDSRGAVLVTEDSMADGGLARIVAVGVSFVSPSEGAYPPYFYGIKGGRVTKYSARDGASLTYLTPADGVASDPQRVGGNVYYLYRHSSCGNPNVLVFVPTTGGPSTTVAVAEPGYAITGFGLTPDATRVTMFETVCTSDSSRPQGLLVSLVRASRTTHTISFQSFPPMVLGDPVWESDGTHVDAVVQTGNMAGVERFAAFSAATVNDGQPACGNTIWSNVGMPQRVAADANGTLWVGTINGGNTRVVRCSDGGAPQRVFDVASSPGPTDLAVSVDGGAVLVADGQSLWRWSGGAVTKLTPKVAQPQVTW